MKVTSGKYKGRTLLGYDLNGTRPTMDRVKESLFAMIQDKIPGSCCLDLFAGSGNLGIEALSEGAIFCTFVDFNKKAVRTIQKNLSLLKVDEKYEIYQDDFSKAIKKLDGKKFDIIFLDPPYDTDYIKRAVACIQKHNLLDHNGYLILESNDPKKMEFDCYRQLKFKKYGDKYICILACE